METIFKNLMFLSQFLTLFTISYMNNYHKEQSLNIAVITKTDTIIQIVYRDTCDSQFMKAILENECAYNTKIENNIPIGKVVGDGGKAYGIYGMHKIYLNVTNIPDLLGYEHEDMFDHDKAHRVFWAVTGVYAYKYYREFHKMPSFEELAQMHNGGYEGRERAKKYLIKFKKNFYNGG